MKQLLLTTLLLCSMHCAIAQTDSVVKHRKLEGAITDKSAVMDESRHYEYTPMGLRAGDMLYVQCESEEFVTTLIIRDSSGVNSVQKVDDPDMFDALGSKTELVYKATQTGAVYIIVTTKYLGKTGKFTLDIAYYSKSDDKVTSKSPFCTKLKYIVDQSNTNFMFMRGKESKGYATRFDPSVLLLAEGTNYVMDGHSAYYSCYQKFETDLLTASARFDELDKLITTCLPRYKRTVEPIESDFDKKYVARRVTYELKGKNAWDMNSKHDLLDRQSRLEMKINISSGKYDVGWTCTR